MIRDECGSVSVVTAAMIVVLLVCSMGITDVVRVVAVRAEARTAADAAALAAAQTQAMPDGTAPVDAAAAAAGRNHAELVSCACPPDGADAVVTVRRTLGGLWLVPGTLTLDVQARAVVDLPA